MNYLNYTFCNRKDWKEKNIDVEDDIVIDNVIGEILDTEGTKKIVSECLWVE